MWRHNIYTLQALVLMIYGINHTHGQSWALLGATQNIALSLGCHVDPTVFGMEPVRVEERRRCWAGLKMLYTIQNTTLGNLDSTQIISTTKAPLDINDDELVAGIEVPTSRAGPTQMSYLLIKFELYGICSRICTEAFGVLQAPSYDTINSLDKEISALREDLNYRYLFYETLEFHHAVQLNILIGYSHQLILLLHRPILRQQDGLYTKDEILSSQKKCIESSQALLSIHALLLEDSSFHPYQWYNRGLGSFHAFHAAVCLSCICIDTELDVFSRDALRAGIRDALDRFDRIAKTGLSPTCRKAVPVLKKLL